MIPVTPKIALAESEVHVEFVRSGGPGGQNVNKVSTAAQLRFDARRSPSLPQEVKERLVKLAGRRMTADGVVLIDASRFRSQERNREDALERLVALLRQATLRPVARRKTRPTLGAKKRRIEHKRRRGEAKGRRGRVSPAEE